MPCLTRVKFPGLTRPSTFEAFSGVITSPGLTWAPAGIAVETIAIVNASAATVAIRFGVICGVLVGEQTCANSPRDRMLSRRRSITVSYPGRREKSAHKLARCYTAGRCIQIVISVSDISCGLENLLARTRGLTKKRVENAAVESRNLTPSPFPNGKGNRILDI